MTISKRDLERRYSVLKDELKALESKCQGGSGTKADYEALAKLKRRMK